MKKKQDALNVVILAIVLIAVGFVWNSYVEIGEIGAGQSASLLLNFSAVADKKYVCDKIECECQSNPLKIIAISADICGSLFSDSNALSNYLDQKCSQACQSQGYSYGLFLSIDPNQCRQTEEACTL